MSEKNRPYFSPLTAISLLLILGLGSSSASAQNYPPEILAYADLILYNGQVLTMDSDQPPIPRQPTRSPPSGSRDTLSSDGADRERRSLAAARRNSASETQWVRRESSNRTQKPEAARIRGETGQADQEVAWSVSSIREYRACCLEAALNARFVSGVMPGRGGRFAGNFTSVASPSRSSSWMNR